MIQEILQYDVGTKVVVRVLRTYFEMLDSDYTVIEREQVRKDSLTVLVGMDCCPSFAAEIGQELQSIVTIEAALLVGAYRELPKDCSRPLVSFLLLSDRS